MAGFCPEDPSAAVRENFGLHQNVAEKNHTRRAIEDTTAARPEDLDRVIEASSPKYSAKMQLLAATRKKNPRTTD